jgi:Uma2 family endonuclease
LKAVTGIEILIQEDFMATASMPLAQANGLVEPRPRRWTKEEYHKMGELGWFVDQRVELLGGEIVEMPVPGNPHCVSTDNVYEVLRGLFPKENFWVRMQMPLDLGLDTEPQPDVAVAAGAKTSFTDHPTSALLVVEVSDSTLAIDRGRKGSLYARPGIADYWVVNLVNRQLEVYRRPVVDEAAPYGYRYGDVSIRAVTEEVSPLAAPQSCIRVADLLP